MIPKQVIIIRKDLGMRRGKEIAQGAHAAMQWLVERLDYDPDQYGETICAHISEMEYRWLTGLATKITLVVNGEEELVAIHEAALNAGLESHIITDVGKTEFGGMPTKTAVSIGPDVGSKLDPVTGHLRLY